MRRRSREINIFSLSALDLFASAMGAFIIIAVILFPYYLKTHTKSDIVKEKSELAKLREQVKLDANVIKQLERENATKSGKLASPFISVIISWSNTNKNNGNDIMGNDVDLHIDDKRLGHRYYYKNKKQTLPGSPAVFEEDTLIGPGNECWSNRAAKPGRYEIHYVLYQKNMVKGAPGDAVVRGTIIHPYGRISIPVKVLTEVSKSKRYYMGTIVVKKNGVITYEQ